MTGLRSAQDLTHARGDARLDGRGRSACEAWPMSDRRSTSTRTGPGWDESVVPFVGDDSRVLVAGDWHGATPWAVTVLERAADLGVSTIVQLGDLGMWMPGRGRRMAEEVDVAGRRTGVRLVFVDGNHDPHARLRQLPVGSDGLARVGQHVFYAPRGSRLDWAGRTLGVLGGAFSVDRAHRTEGLDLWADLEEVTAEDVARLGAGPVDVLLTHEAPAGVELRASLRVDEFASYRADRQRALVRRAVDATGPQLVFHGHWHHRHTSTLIRGDGGATTVVGLSEEYSVGNWVVLDLFDLDVRAAPGLL